MVMALTPTLAWPQAAAAEPPDEVFPGAALVWGKRTSRSECEATRHAVWVVHKEGEACIRYFPSSNVDGAKTAAFFFHGDLLFGRSVIQGAYGNNKASVLLKKSESLARVHGVPYIFVGRPGAYGSSGSHMERRKIDEYLAMNAAVDAIKAKHGIEKVHLGGQSGGAIVAAALLTLRWGAQTSCVPHLPAARMTLWRERKTRPCSKASRGKVLMHTACATPTT